ncbi:MAG: hypothetical protein ACREFP_23930 [Acetobacteraceae bacterium]
MKPLDGDLRSRTLSAFYPAVDKSGRPILDGASTPRTDELPDIKEWMSGELDSIVADRVSRVLDLSGGDRVMQEYVRDLALIDFCREFAVDPVVAVYVGPEMEDFRHATQFLLSGEFACDRVLLVLNEGVIRQGQTTAGAFDPIRCHPDFERLLSQGARPMFLRRLTCMSVLRERGLRLYELLDRSPGSVGASVSPTLYHMTKTWLDGFEQELKNSGAAEWLP